jgi:hypothetical protein
MKKHYANIIELIINLKGEILIKFPEKIIFLISYYKNIENY